MPKFAVLLGMGIEYLAISGRTSQNYILVGGCIILAGVVYGLACRRRTVKR